MKKLIFFGLIIAAFWSCSIDDSPKEVFLLEILPIESASVPTEMSFGETYTINYSYLKPTTCHTFNDLYYIAESNVRTVAVISKVLIANEGIICQALTNELEERSFSFVANNREGTYVFKFWQGEDDNGQDTYLIYEVPIRQ